MGSGFVNLTKIPGWHAYVVANDGIYLEPEDDRDHWLFEYMDMGLGRINRINKGWEYVLEYGRSEPVDPIPRKIKPVEYFKMPLYVSDYADMPMVPEIWEAWDRDEGYVRDYRGKYYKEHKISDTLWECTYE